MIYSTSKLDAEKEPIQVQLAQAWWRVLSNYTGMTHTTVQLKAWRVQLYNYCLNQGCWWPIRFEIFDIVMILWLLLLLSWTVSLLFFLHALPIFFLRKSQELARKQDRSFSRIFLVRIFDFPIIDFLKSWGEIPSCTKSGFLFFNSKDDFKHFKSDTEPVSTNKLNWSFTN